MNFQIANAPAKSVVTRITRFNFSGSTKFKTYVLVIDERNGSDMETIRES